MFDAELTQSFSPSRRRWTTLASFGIQTIAVGLLLMLPVIYTEALPRLTLRDVGAPLPPRGAPPKPSQERPAKARQSNLVNGIVVAPPRIPPEIADIDERDLEQAPDLGPYVPGAASGPGSRNPVIDSVVSSVMPYVPPKPHSAAPPRPISRMMEGNLVGRVEPVYPVLARQAGIQGAVVLRAVISRDGSIKNLRAVSGHPWLVQAAIDAVRQWRYRPYMLNGEPVEVETQVTVNFVLTRGWMVNPGTLVTFARLRLPDIIAKEWPLPSQASSTEAPRVPHGRRSRSTHCGRTSG